MKDLRTIVIRVVIGSFSIAALLGIIALLGAGFGETEARVLLTTVIVGVESVAALCFLAVAGRPSALLGLTGAITSLVPFAIALWLTWSAFDDFDNDLLWKVFGVSVTIAASIAQACLLLALARRTWLLTATLLIIAVVAVMIVVPIIDGSGLDDTYWRIFGILAILDVLGTVSIAALSAFGRRDPEPSAVMTLTPATQSVINELAAQHGIDPQRVLDEALAQYRDSPT